MKLSNYKWLGMALFTMAVNTPSADGIEMDQTRMKQTVADIFAVVWNKADFSGIDEVWSTEVVSLLNIRSR